MKKTENRINDSVRKQERAFLKKQFETGLKGKLNMQQVNQFMYEQASMRSSMVDSNRNLRHTIGNP